MEIRIRPALVKFFFLCGERRRSELAFHSELRMVSQTVRKSGSRSFSDVAMLSVTELVTLSFSLGSATAIPPPAMRSFSSSATATGSVILLRAPVKIFSKE